MIFLFSCFNVASLSCLELDNSFRMTKTGVCWCISSACSELHRESFTEAEADPRREERDSWVLAVVHCCLLLDQAGLLRINSLEACLVLALNST